MADKPILFSGPMVRALLAGTKTQTRRTFKGVEEVRPGYFHAFGSGGGIFCDGEAEVKHWAPSYLRIAPGDRLYVREHWRAECTYDDVAPRDLTPDGQQWRYEADGLWSDRDAMTAAAGRFRQGMHMPRWASRLTLTVTDVRVERLQDISEADAQAEGITRIGAEYIARGSKEWESGPNFYQVDIGGGTMNDATAVAVYMRLWDWINGEGASAANPWVAAYTFTVEHGNIDQLARAA